MNILLFDIYPSSNTVHRHGITGGLGLHLRDSIYTVLPSSKGKTGFASKDRVNYSRTDKNRKVIDLEVL